MASFSIGPTTVLSRRPVKPSEFIEPQCFTLKSRTTRPFNVSCHHSCFEIRDIKYRPPGTQINLLNEVNLSLPEKSFGLIFGRSGSGKTTLLQLITGLTKPTSGSIYIQKYGDDGKPNCPPEVLSPERVGIVFQFPESSQEKGCTRYCKEIFCILETHPCKNKHQKWPILESSITIDPHN